MTSARRKARAIALKAMYEFDAVGHDAMTVAERFLTEAGLSEENNEFVRSLVSGVTQNRVKIDDNIKTFAPLWPLEQISLIDRNILRLAIFEILFDNRIPVKVAINEVLTKV